MGHPVVPLVLLAIDTPERPEGALGVLNLAVSQNTAGVETRRIVARDPDGVGYSKMFNRGVALLRQKSYDWDYMCIMMSDAVCKQEGWLARLVEVADSDPTYGFIGPSMLTGARPQHNGVEGMDKGHSVVVHLALGIALIRREIIETIPMNEDYYHYGSDYEMINLAHERGWKAVWVHDVWVDHDWIPGSEAYPEWYEHDQALHYSRWDRQGNRCRGTVTKSKG